MLEHTAGAPIELMDTVINSPLVAVNVALPGVPVMAPRVLLNVTGFVSVVIDNDVLGNPL